MDDKNLFSRALSAKNPPAFCIPVPVPYVPIIAFDMCMKLFNIFTPGRNLHMCIDLETKIQNAQLLVLHFDCMRMGQDGFSLLKPDDNGGLVIPTPAPEIGQQLNADVFDEVEEIKKKIKMDFNELVLCKVVESLEKYTVKSRGNVFAVIQFWKN